MIDIDERNTSSASRASQQARTAREAVIRHETGYGHGTKDNIPVVTESKNVDDIEVSKGAGKGSSGPTSRPNLEWLRCGLCT